MSIRKKHLILTGIPEDDSEQKSVADTSEGETDQFATHRVALKTLASIHDVLIFDDIDCAYRIGRKGAKPRPILVKFCCESVRDLVNKKRFHLKDCDDTKATYINDDLPSKINQQRTNMRSVVENAKANSVNAKTMGSRVQVGEKPSEHAYQFDRVTYLGDHKLASQVFHAHTPQEAKRIGGQIGPSKKWDMVKIDRMKLITMAKYSQNPRLRNELLKTAPSPLIEATLDNF